MIKFFAPAIAIATGLLVLFGYFFPNEALNGIRVTIVQWAIILAGAAVLVGIINLFSVHFKKIKNQEKGSVYSLLLIASLLLSLVLGLLLGTSSSIMQDVFNAVILPVESSLLAIMAVTLIYAGIRLLGHRNDLMAMMFLAFALLAMLIAAPLPFFELPLMDDFIRPLIVEVLATSGARGILLGVALGTLLTGIRVLIGSDRPYGGK